MKINNLPKICQEFYHQLYVQCTYIENKLVTAEPREEEKVEGNSSSSSRESGHSVGNLCGIIQVFTFAKDIQTSTETEEAEECQIT